MDIQLKTGCFDDAALVRRVVFMDEQGYENEFDAIDEDPNCIHGSRRKCWCKGDALAPV